MPVPIRSRTYMYLVVRKVPVQFFDRFVRNRSVEKTHSFGHRQPSSPMNKLSSHSAIAPPSPMNKPSSHLSNRAPHSLIMRMSRPLCQSTHLTSRSTLTTPCTFTPTYCARGIFHVERFHLACGMYYVPVILYYLSPQIVQGPALPSSTVERFAPHLLRSARGT